MNRSEELKSIVREKYTQVAAQSREMNAGSCCGVDACCTVDYSVFADDYKKLEGYIEEADLALGCGIPTEFAQIRPGDTVLDLGSGAGNDVFVARTLAGSTGKVIGVDMTAAMVEKARANNEKLGFNNVEFRSGDIEQLPVAANTIDVVVSNCVLNLVPDKRKAFSEAFRVLKVGGHFSISDVVVSGNLPDALQSAAGLYAGCVSGAIRKDVYLAIIRESGFDDVRIMKEKPITLPDEVLRGHLTEDEFTEFRSSGAAITSVTVYGRKSSCCTPGQSCC